MSYNSLTVRVSFTLTGEDRFTCKSHDWDRYRGRSPFDIEVPDIEVDLIEFTVKATGAAILLNGETSGYGHWADLTEDQQVEWFKKAMGIYSANKGKVG